MQFLERDIEEIAESLSHDTIEHVAVNFIELDSEELVVSDILITHDEAPSRTPAVVDPGRHDSHVPTELLFRWQEDLQNASCPLWS